MRPGIAASVSGRLRNGKENIAAFDAPMAHEFPVFWQGNA